MSDQRYIVKYEDCDLYYLSEKHIPKEVLVLEYAYKCKYIATTQTFVITENVPDDIQMSMITTKMWLIGNPCIEFKKPCDDVLNYQALERL